MAKAAEGGKSIVNVTGKRIAQVGIVVRDVVRTAKRYGELFGVGPWAFLDMVPKGGTFRGRHFESGHCGIRIALAEMGGLQLELLEPLFGRSTHREFLETRGQGVHHVSFGPIPDHDQTISAFQQAGFGIEMQGSFWDVATATYVDSVDALGTLFEVVRFDAPPPAPWGIYTASGPGVVDLSEKRITQLGFVVRDVEETAQHYWELFGIGPWSFFELGPGDQTECAFRGVPLTGGDLRFRFAFAVWDGLQFELIEPVSGTSPHMDFLRTRGHGIQHLSFGPIGEQPSQPIPDREHFLSTLKRQGSSVQFQGLIGGALRFDYIDMQEELGTVFEVIGAVPGVEPRFQPYGTFPP